MEKRRIPTFDDFVNEDEIGPYVLVKSTLLRGFNFDDPKWQSKIDEIKSQNLYFIDIKDSSILFITATDNENEYDVGEKILNIDDSGRKHNSNLLEVSKFLTIEEAQIAISKRKRTSVFQIHWLSREPNARWTK